MATTSAKEWQQQGTTRYASESAHRLMQDNGLDQLETVFARASTGHLRHDGRRVAEWHLEDQQGNDHHVFAKTQWGRPRIVPRMSDFTTRRFDQRLPVREWQGLRQLASIGLLVAEPLALFCSRGFDLRSVVVLRAVPGPVSFEDMIRNGFWNRLERPCQDRLLDEIVATLARIHSHGLGWHGAEACHFFPEFKSDQWSVWLIDCEGIHRRYRKRVVRRDHSRLLESVEESGSDGALLKSLKRKLQFHESS